jgi:hypothetical protein
VTTVRNKGCPFSARRVYRANGPFFAEEVDFLQQNANIFVTQDYI